MSVTWNPNDTSAAIALSNGNLTATSTDQSWKSVRATRAAGIGKFYYEVKCTAGDFYDMIGWGLRTAGINNYCGVDASSWAWNGQALKFHGGISSALGTTLAVNDVMMTAIDLPSGNMWFGKNGTWFEGNPVTGATPSYTAGTGPLYPMASLYANGNAGIANFGATSFAYTIPTGFSAVDTLLAPIPNWFKAISRTKVGNAILIAWKWGDKQHNRDYVAKVLPGGIRSFILTSVQKVAGPLSVSGTARLSDNSTIATNVLILSRQTGQVLNKAVPDQSTGAYSIPAYPWSEVDTIGYKDYGTAWTASTTYEVNALVHPTAANANGHYYKQLTSGTVSGYIRATSGSSEPTWTTTPGGTVTDGGITWVEQGTMLRPMIHGPIVPA